MVSDIPAGDGKLAQLFLQCIVVVCIEPAFCPDIGLSAFHFIFVKIEEEREKLPRNYYQLPFTPHTHTHSVIGKVPTVRHVTGTGTGLLGEIPRVVVQKSALL